MISVEFSNACTEVLEILQHVDKEDIKKIPQKEIKNLKDNANKKYIFHYNVNKTIKEQNVSKMAKAIIAIYYEKYIK